jgi:exosortase H (IPTLxxWG-CTERM-specific)
MSKKSAERATEVANSQRAMIAWFLGLSAAYMIAGVILLDVPLVRDGFVDPWTRFNASASATMASLFGVDSTATGTFVQSGAAHLDIKAGCNGAHALLILLASVFAFPAPWGRRLIGALAGTLAVLGFNLIRLINLIVVARYFPARLELFHIYIWQTLIILIALGVFLVWGNFFAENRSGARAVHSA